MALPPEDPLHGSRFPGIGNRNRPLLLGAIVILVLLAIMFGMRQIPVGGPESGTVKETTTTTEPATTPPATAPSTTTPPPTTPPPTTTP